MTLKQIYEEGKDTGYDIGKTALNGAWGEIPDNEDDFVTEVFQTEENARCFSSFEFTAKEFNDHKDPDRAWEEYERGIGVGASKAYRNHKKTLSA